MAGLLYEYKLNSVNFRWIPFNEFKNIKYLVKGGFSEVQKAEWFDYYDIHNIDEDIYEKGEVVLKRLRLYNSRDNILKEINKKKV